MALADAVEITLGLSDEMRAEVESKLAEFGGPPFQTLVLRYSKRLRQIMKKGKAASVDDYYLLKGALDGGHLENHQRETSTIQILADFEEQQESTR